MASISRMWRGTGCRVPRPRLAPFTRPAMSTNSIAAGTGFGEPGQCGPPPPTAVRHGHHAEVRFDRAEGVVRRVRFAGSRDRVEQSGLADVRQTDDSGAKHGKHHRYPSPPRLPTTECRRPGPVGQSRHSSIRQPTPSADPKHPAALAATRSHISRFSGPAPSRLAVVRDDGTCAPRVSARRPRFVLLDKDRP